MFDRLRKNLVFVHIPKTGGTSARHALLAFENRRAFVRDYGPGSPETTAELRDALYDPAGLAALGERLDDNRGTFVIGHFRARKYRRLFPLSDFATVLREPIDRLVSEYNHHVAHAGLEEPFEAFMLKPRFRNMTSAMLDGVDIDRFGFLGVTEALDRDFERFGRFLGAGIPPKKTNLGRYDEATRRLKENDGLMAEARRLNADDVALYDYVVARLNGLTTDRPARVAAGRAGVWGQVSLNPEKGVVGWVGRRAGAEPALIRLVAGSRVLAETQAIRPRPDVWNSLLTEHPDCGFLVPFDRIGRVPEIRVLEGRTGVELQGSPLRMS